MEERQEVSVPFLYRVSSKLATDRDSLPASPKPIHWVVSSRTMEGIVVNGFLKYRSRIARISVA